MSKKDKKSRRSRAVKILKKKKKKPRFPRQHAHAKVKVRKKGWRKPRGRYSAQRRKYKSRGKHPVIGYKKSSDVRGLHPSGFKDVLVRNVNDLNGLKEEIHAVRIARKVGKKKRAQIVKKAEEMKLKILNK